MIDVIARSMPWKDAQLLSLWLWRCVNRTHTRGSELLARSSGRIAVAAVAYRAGPCLCDERQMIEHDLHAAKSRREYSLQFRLTLCEKAAWAKGGVCGGFKSASALPKSYDRSNRPAFGWLPAKQERLGVRPLATEFERAEIPVPLTTRHVRLGLDPETKLVEVRDAD
jgi:hypothetical protein